MSFLKRLSSLRQESSHSDPLLEKNGHAVMFLFVNVSIPFAGAEGQAVIDKIMTDADQIKQRTRKALGITIQLCNGFFKLAPTGYPNADQILATWVKDGTFGADASNVEEGTQLSLSRLSNRATENSSESDDRPSYFVACSPISDRYELAISSALTGKLPGYRGAIHFRGQRTSAELGRQLYLPGGFELKI